MNQPTNTKNSLEVPIRPIIRLMIKKLNKVLNRFVQHIWAKVDFEKVTTHIGQPIMNLIQVQKMPILPQNGFRVGGMMEALFGFFFYMQQENNYGGN